MSLIHEALQKAEAERRAGELPPLLSVTGPKETRSPTRAPLWLLAPLVLVVAAVAYSNRSLIQDTLRLGDAAESKPSASVPVPTPAVLAGAETAPKADVPRAPSSVPAEAETTMALAVVPAPLEVATNPAQKPRADVAPPAAEAAVAPPDPQSVPTPMVAEPVETPPAETVAAVDATPEPPELAIDAAGSAAPDGAVAATPEAPAAPVAAPAPAPDASPATVAPAVPYVFELPLGTRQALPALKVTMHVYNADAARRFAIIDGKRVNEGGILGNDLNVIEIQRDAILIDFRGTRFLLPRIGR